MKTKTNMKNRLGNGGFSLVELIVVIAIMAILAAVAVIGVSVYVDKAAEAADKKTITDIENALILGGYDGAYAPGTVVGAVGISKDADATASNAEIEKIMVDAFGANWKSELKLQSDVFEGSDESKIIEAIKENSQYFAQVPDSSFYVIEGNTKELVADVDEISTALTGVLTKNAYTFSKFWGTDFKNSVSSAGLDGNAGWMDDPQMAANLTVFAAASQIKTEVKNDSTKLQSWVDGWATGDDTIVVTTNENGYVADVVMKYGQCVAAYNWALANPTLACPDALKNNPTEALEWVKENYGDQYEILETKMVGLADADNVVDSFKAAIDQFWRETGDLRTKWQNSGAAAKDAEAFLASMLAVNSLEGNYVTKDQKDKLTESQYFEKAGAADVLDTMVNYSEISRLDPNFLSSDNYVIVLLISDAGVPTVTPAISRD